MKTKLVTAIYTDIKGHPFYGHEVYARHERYLHSLRTLNNLNVEITCFCNQTQYDLLEAHLKQFSLTNITLKVSNLFEFPFSSRMLEIKEKTNDYKFYHEVDWNKFYLLSKEFDSTFDYMYWIDAGLSHRGLFLEKYNPYADKIDGMSRTYENYSFTGIFNDLLFKKINDWVGDKLINLSNNLVSHECSKMYQALKIQTPFRRMSIGGIIGGKTNLLQWFLEEFNRVGTLLLEKELIINHEAIISYIVEHNMDKFKTFQFDTWYHDDFWKTTPHFDRDSIKNQTHFVHFFEKELGI
jgi:hypothetical protein